jgi:hypothetical protein
MAGGVTDSQVHELQEMVQKRKHGAREIRRGPAILKTAR